MTRDGYAIIETASGAIVRSMGSLPNLLKLPSGDAVQPGTLGTYGKYQVVERWRDQPAADRENKLSDADESFDGTKTTITYTLVPRSAEEIAAIDQAADARKQDQVDGIEKLQFYVAFNHENRIRVLEGKAAITAVQFRAALKEQL